MVFQDILTVPLSRYIDCTSNVNTWPSLLLCFYCISKIWIIKKNVKNKNPSLAVYVPVDEIMFIVTLALMGDHSGMISSEFNLIANLLCRSICFATCDVYECSLLEHLYHRSFKWRVSSFQKWLGGDIDFLFQHDKGRSAFLNNCSYWFYFWYCLLD